MPNKTIYVADNDVPLLEQAQQLTGGNLSAAIIEALRTFVVIKEGIMAEHTTIEVTTGPAGAQTRRQFVGTRLATWFRPQRQVRDFPVGYTVYRTARQRLAVHTRRPVILPTDEADWHRLSDPATWPDPDGQLNEQTTADLTVYDTVDQLAVAVPAELADRVRHANAHPDVEVLDI